MNTPIVAQKPIAASDRIPTIFGTQDAKHGAGFCPEMYFSHPLDKRDYALGYEAIIGPTFFTAQFTGSPISAEVATAGYVECMAVVI
jgi:hypothetical protein